MLITINTNKVARIIKQYHLDDCEIVRDLAKYFKKTATGACGAVNDCQAPCGHKCPYPDELSCNDCKWTLANFDPEDFIKKCGG